MTTWNDRFRKKVLASKQMHKIPECFLYPCGNISHVTQIYVTAVHPVTPDIKSDSIARDFRSQYILHILAFELCFTGCSARQRTLFVQVAILYAFFKMVMSGELKTYYTFVS